MRNILVVMVKEPHPGRVKTRLGRDLGMVAAAWWFRHQVRRLLREVDDPRWQVVLAVSPDCEGLTSRVWPRHIPRIAQGTGDLGARMMRVFGALQPGRVCIIGADIPGVRAPMIARAFQALGRADAVFGPSCDGGYWLIGLRKMPAGALRNVRWSTSHALVDTQRSLAGLRVTHIETLRDVDTVDDL